MSTIKVRVQNFFQKHFVPRRDFEDALAVCDVYDRLADAQRASLLREQAAVQALQKRITTDRWNATLLVLRLIESELSGERLARMPFFRDTPEKVIARLEGLLLRLGRTCSEAAQ